MGNTNQKETKEDKNNSNSSVLNLSLCSIDSILDSSSSNSDFKTQLKHKVNLPIENENLESKEIILEGKEEEIKKYFIDDDKDNNYFKSSIFDIRRSKTYNANHIIKKAPKPQLKISNEYISPLKLNTKNYGIFPKFNKKPNSVLYDFQKNIIDCKSCNDEEKNFDEFFLTFSETETERTTPNAEDLQNLLDCRKKMTIFRNSIDERTCKEYENILNSENIFIDESKKINSNKQHHKKNKFWHKHIKQQQLKYSNKMFSSNFSGMPDENDIKRAETNINESSKDHGLFILGILESAANERKGRNTVNV